MTYNIIIGEDGIKTIQVNSSIYFSWDPLDNATYGVFMEQVDIQGMEVFAQLLSNDPNTAFSIFTGQ